MEQKLDLLGNSIDSLNESLRQYRLGVLTTIHLKFSVLLFAHFVELLQAHLLYLERKKPSFRNPGFVQSTKALKFHSSHPMPEVLVNHIDELRSQRNRIQHSAFSYHPFEVRELISNIISNLDDYCKRFGVDICSLIWKEFTPLYSQLANSKEAMLAIAQDKAVTLSETGVAYGCVVCKKNRVASAISGEIVCQYCNDVTTLDA